MDQSSSPAPEPAGESATLSAGHRGHSQSRGPMGMDSVLTDEERRVFKECNQESFWYRSVPISISSMAATQFLISRGTLTASTRFGSVPKVLCKISYVTTCQEKFKRLENSPLGEALRQRHRPPCSRGQSELSDGPVWSEGVLQSDVQRDSDGTPPPGYPQSHEFSDNEEVQKRRFYEDLRSRNRTVAPGQEPGPFKPAEKQVKKNVYGDVWED